MQVKRKDQQFERIKSKNEFNVTREESLCNHFNLNSEIQLGSTNLDLELSTWKVSVRLIPFLDVPVVVTQNSLNN